VSSAGTYDFTGSVTAPSSLRCPSGFVSVRARSVTPHTLHAYATYARCIPAPQSFLSVKRGSQPCPSMTFVTVSQQGTHITLLIRAYLIHPADRIPYKPQGVQPHQIAITHHLISPLMCVCVCARARARVRVYPVFGHARVHQEGCAATSVYCSHAACRLTFCPHSGLVSGTSSSAAILTSTTIASSSGSSGCLSLASFLSWAASLCLHPPRTHTFSSVEALLIICLWTLGRR
jgi:hypothetical protein